MWTAYGGSIAIEVRNPASVAIYYSTELFRVNRL
jgi:hypothetical protein